MTGGLIARRFITSPLSANLTELSLSHTLPVFWAIEREKKREAGRERERGTEKNERWKESERKTMKERATRKERERERERERFKRGLGERQVGNEL